MNTDMVLHIEYEVPREVLMMGQSRRATWATGGLIFAATMLIIIGIFQVLTGIAAVANRAFFLIVGNSYAYQLDVRSWGWIHIGVGIVVILIGFALFSGTIWARALGIAIATISAISYFFFVPYYPLWSLLVIALNIFAIWAMATGRETGRRSAMPANSAGEMYGAPGSDQEAGQRWPSTNQPADYGVARSGRWTSDATGRPGGTPQATGTPQMPSTPQTPDAQQASAGQPVHAAPRPPGTSSGHGSSSRQGGAQTPGGSQPYGATEYPASSYPPPSGTSASDHGASSGRSTPSHQDMPYGEDMPFDRDEGDGPR